MHNNIFFLNREVVEQEQILLQNEAENMKNNLMEEITYKNFLILDLKSELKKLENFYLNEKFRLETEILEAEIEIIEGHKTLNVLEDILAGKYNIF